MRQHRKCVSRVLAVLLNKTSACLCFCYCPVPLRGLSHTVNNLQDFKCSSWLVLFMDPFVLFLNQIIYSERLLLSNCICKLCEKRLFVKVRNSGFRDSAGTSMDAVLKVTQQADIILCLSENPETAACLTRNLFHLCCSSPCGPHGRVVLTFSI